MDTENVWQRIEKLPNLLHKISTGDEAAIQELRDLYLLSLGKTMKRECSSCRLRAYQEITNLTKEKINTMAKQKFSFKNDDALVYFGHAHYSKANLTDDVAEAMIKSNPANADLFNGPVDDVQADEPKKPKKEKGQADEPNIEVPAETVITPEQKD